MAGRNESKLLQVLKNASETVGADLKETPKISKNSIFYVLAQIVVSFAFRAFKYEGAWRG